MFADPVFTQQTSWEENQFHIREEQLQSSPGNRVQLKVKPSAVVRLEVSMN
jgi:hypothetical protein